MYFVYVDARKGYNRVLDAKEWLKEVIGGEAPDTWFEVDVDAANKYRLGHQEFAHLNHAWVICDAEHAMAFKLRFS